MRYANELSGLIILQIICSKLYYSHFTNEEFEASGVQISEYLVGPEERIQN